ncbi:MAG: sulfide/dihydroorotate dehydrogenase-like FAD/NAD-binding protein [Bacteroidales bacterium]|nr:sulfide/dihydroorotate dehydrogenase-like FAD/NAD-binding protein [Bacteroidales bacterium]
MFTILTKTVLTPAIVQMEVLAPRVAASALPGQFLIVRTHPLGERIPLTICDYDRKKGTVTIVTQIVGASSHKICELEEGASFADVVGPLGRPSDFVEYSEEKLRNQRYLFVAGGLGTAPVYPQVKYLYERGVAVDVVIGAKSKDYVIFEQQMQAVCDHLYVCTDDGTYGRKGLVTDCVRELLEDGAVHYDQAVAIGPMVMMKYVALTTKPFDLPLVVSLNTLMVDGTGMCGACRVTIAGKTKFACVDGPEFNAYEVDFDEAIRRQSMYREQEVEANHQCRLENGQEIRK